MPIWLNQIQALKERLITSLEGETPLKSDYKYLGRTANTWLGVKFKVILIIKALMTAGNLIKYWSMKSMLSFKYITEYDKLCKILVLFHVNYNFLPLISTNRKLHIKLSLTKSLLKIRQSDLVLHNHAEISFNLGRAFHSALNTNFFSPNTHVALGLTVDLPLGWAIGQEFNNQNEDNGDGERPEPSFSERL